MISHINSYIGKHILPITLLFVHSTTIKCYKLGYKIYKSCQNVRASVGIVYFRNVHKNDIKQKV